MILLWKSLTEGRVGTLQNRPSSMIWSFQGSAQTGRWKEIRPNPPKQGKGFQQLCFFWGIKVVLCSQPIVPHCISGLHKSVPHRLRQLNTQSQEGGFLWAGLGGVAMLQEAFTQDKG